MLLLYSSEKIWSVEKVEKNEIYKEILELREKMYNATMNDADIDEATRKHVKDEYASCDKEKLCDDIIDELLDSFGS